MLPTATDGSSARAVAHRCAEAATAIIAAAARRPRETIAKGQTSGGRNDLVTVTDGEVERTVVSILRAAFPDHAVLGEETGAHAAGSDWVWVIDPIDGTRNFSAGVPWHAFNLALYHGDDPRLALTADPLRDELFYAERGGGATLNGAPIQVNRTGRLADAFLAFDLGLDDTRAIALLDAVRALFPNVQGVRLPGTVAIGMAYVAAGRFDAYIHPSPYAWDTAPGILLVQEAGGAVTELDGTPITLASRSVVAGAAGVHADAVAHFRSVISSAIS